MPVLIENNATSTLANPVSPLDTSITVATGEGTLFPNPGTEEYFYVTIEDSAGQIEILKCTSRTNDILTVDRAQDGTTALTFAIGAIVEVRPIRATHYDIRTEAHGYLTEEVTADQPVEAKDKGKMLRCTSGVNLTFDASSSLGDGFVVRVNNDSPGDVIVTPDGAETVNGLPSATVAAGKDATVISDGTNLFTYSETAEVSADLPYKHLNGMILTSEDRSGTELISSFTNISYDTFTSAGQNITSAIKSSGGTQEAHSNSFTVGDGIRVILSTTLTLNSGQAPYVELINSVGGRVSNIEQLSAGANTIELITFEPADQLRIYNTANGDWSAATVSVQESPMDKTKDVGVGAGEARDYADSVNMELGAELIKDIKQAWAQGTNQGGFPDSLVLSTDTWYHVFVISKPDGTTDAGFDTDISATNLLADANVVAGGYTKYRRVGSVLMDGTPDITEYKQVGDTFWWNPYIEDTTSVPGSSYQDLTVSTPLGVETEGIFTVRAQGGPTSNEIEFGYKSKVTSTEVYGPDNSVSATSNESDQAYLRIVVDTNSQIQEKETASGSPVSYNFRTVGWVDLRGKE